MKRLVAAVCALAAVISMAQSVCAAYLRSDNYITMLNDKDITCLTPGDVNFDGVINAADMSLMISLYEYYFDKINTLPFPLAVPMDVYRDGVLNSKDIARFMQYLAGWHKNVLHDPRKTSLSSLYFTTGSDTLNGEKVNYIYGSKDVVFTDTNGNAEWRFTLFAGFRYQKDKWVECCDAWYINDIFDDAWTFSEGSARIVDESSADGHGKYSKKVLFITVRNVEVNISLTCDVYGNLS